MLKRQVGGERADCATALLPDEVRLGGLDAADRARAAAQRRPSPGTRADGGIQSGGGRPDYVASRFAPALHRAMAALSFRAGRPRTGDLSAELAAGVTSPETIAGIKRTMLWGIALLWLLDAIRADDPEITTAFQPRRALPQASLAGRAQGQVAEGENALPTTRSMLTGSLFGRFGRGNTGDR